MKKEGDAARWIDSAKLPPDIKKQFDFEKDQVEKTFRYWIEEDEKPILVEGSRSRSIKQTRGLSKLILPLSRKRIFSSRHRTHINARNQTGRPGMNSDGDETLEKSQRGVSYWQGVKATVDGMLGGYGLVNGPDVEGSEAFLKSILAERFPDSGRGRPLVALDCGAGIGRVTKNLLIRYFNEVDLLEPVTHFLETARADLAPENLRVSEEYRAVNFFGVPLQEFTPVAERYDIIWVQWCIGHLSDDEFVSFFDKAKGCLKPDGLFVLKENVAKSGFVLDKKDKSVTRSDLYFKQLFTRCGLHIYKMKDQKGFPDELFAVKMYALTTELPKKVNTSGSKRHCKGLAINK